MTLMLGILALVVVALLWEWLLSSGAPRRSRRQPLRRQELLEKVTRLRF
ncbi:hypothetical protein WCLP8_3570002 [uncultured Gammaproteobacteria bacterium]